MEQQIIRKVVERVVATMSSAKTAAASGMRLNSTDTIHDWARRGNLSAQIEKGTEIFLVACISGRADDEAIKSAQFLDEQWHNPDGLLARSLREMETV